MLKGKNFPFALFSISLFLILTLPALVQEGMFLDGTLYASIARNMANELGSFWMPHYTAITNPVFYGHPPMAMGIESILFNCLGDHIYVEKIYSLLTGLITLFLITLLWKIIHVGSDATQKLSWLPVLFWAIIPVVGWSYSNNMLDNTQCIFCLLACICLLQNFFSEKKYIFYPVLSGIFIFMALLTKGPLGMFPIVIPFLYLITTNSISFNDALKNTFVILIVLIIISVVLMMYEPAKKFIVKYIHVQLESSLTGVLREESHFVILKIIGMELIPVMAITLIVIGVYKLKNKTASILSGQNDQLTFFFLLLAISASFPIMISNKQLRFYLIPALPYFAIGFSLFILPIVKEWIEQINIKARYFLIMRALSIAIFTGTILYSAFLYGKVGRDADMIHDIKLIGKIVGRDQIIGECKEIYKNWGLHAYFARYYNISLNTKHKNCRYLILSKSCTINDIEEYQKINLTTKELDLYQLKNDSISEIFKETLQTATTTM